MSDSTSEKMKCWGCKIDKPKSDFDKNPALCRVCVGATVVTTNRRGRSRGSMGGWLDGLADSIGDLIEDLLS